MELFNLSIHRLSHFKARFERYNKQYIYHRYRIIASLDFIYFYYFAHNHNMRGISNLIGISTQKNVLYLPLIEKCCIWILNENTPCTVHLSLTLLNKYITRLLQFIDIEWWRIYRYRQFLSRKLQLMKIQNLYIISL